MLAPDLQRVLRRVLKTRLFGVIVVVFGLALPKPLPKLEDGLWIPPTSPRFARRVTGHASFSWKVR